MGTWVAQVSSDQTFISRLRYSWVGNALKTASKADTAEMDKLEFIGVVKDFVLVVENKAEIPQYASRDADDNLLEDTVSKQAHALNQGGYAGRKQTIRPSFRSKQWGYCLHRE